MKKIFAFLAGLAFYALPLCAQLPDGIVAPNFTATDLNGNTWTLYDLLDQGKSAALFFGTTWSYDSWQYHQSGRFNQVWEQYGPDGTGEIVPFFIEIDDNTNSEDLNGTGGNTYGDWVTGTPYPIIDDGSNVGDTYLLDGIPRVYFICPNRILSHAEDFSTTQFGLAHNACLLPGGTNNVGMLRFVAAPKEFCNELTFTPNVRFQNLGSAALTSLSLQLLLDGNVVETRNWTGNLDLYQTAGLLFNPVTISDNTNLAVLAATTNGTTDDDPANDLLSTDIAEGAVLSTNFLVVEIKTDDYPWETYWEVVDENGTVFHAGGNPGIFTDEEWEGTYANANEVYQHEVALPSDGCYEFVIYDRYDDGICCEEGLGYYRLMDENNFIYLQGGLFSEPEHRPFQLSGAATILDNATIRGYQGPSGDFCGKSAIGPSLAVQNVGANTIQSLDIGVLFENSPVQSFAWAGTLAPGQTDTIALDPVTLQATGELRFVIEQANQAPDTFDFQNDWEVGFSRRLPLVTQLTLEFGTDEWGYENYWQLTNSAGDLIASGGNQVIGPDGGYLQVATAADPGAYPPFSVVTESILLPDGENDCYEFLFVDDWGDGINEPGFIKMSDNLGTLLFNFRPLNSGNTYLLDGQFGINATATPVSPAQLSLSPNPVSDRLEVAFWVEKSGPVRIEAYQALGSRVATLAEGPMPAGLQHRQLDVAGWASGVYFLKMTTADGGQVVRRFVVQQR